MKLLDISGAAKYIGCSGIAGASTGVTSGDGLAFSYDLATGKFEMGSYFMGGGGSYVGLGASFTLYEIWCQISAIDFIISSIFLEIWNYGDFPL